MLLFYFIVRKIFRTPSILFLLCFAGKLFCLFETEFQYVAQAGLKLRSSSLCLPSARITGVSYYWNYPEAVQSIYFSQFLLHLSKWPFKLFSSPLSPHHYLLTARVVPRYRFYHVTSLLSQLPLCS